MGYNTQMYMGKVFSKIAIAVCLLSVCVYASGCYSISKLFREEEPMDPAAMSRFWDGPKVAPGIALNVVVSSSSMQPVQMKVLVDQNGDLTLPHLLQQPVHCDGLTLDELKQKLVKEYSVYYRQPLVSVTFGEYDGRGVSPWGTVMVMGEVAVPGPVNMPSTMDLTVTKVLQLAGNLRPYADKTAIVVWRTDREGRRTRTKIDLRDIGQGGRPDLDMQLRAGDVVYVPETWY